MRELPRIKAAYDWMVEAYQTEVATAMATNDTRAVERLEEMRDMLERGVFVVLFGQFEMAMNEHFERARENRATNPDWTTRRGWDVPAYGTGRDPFETKLALVLDRREPDHGRILAAYARRNHCAHGGISQPVGSIDQFVSDLRRWRALLRS